MDKRVVSEAKGKVYKDMYKHLSTEEGVNENFKFANAQNKRRQYISSVRYIKDKRDHVLLHDEDIKERRGRYFHELFNTSRGREIVLEHMYIQFIETD